MTLDQHLEAAQKIKQIQALFSELEACCDLPKQSTVTKALRGLKRLEDIRGSLDSEYHKIITDEEFQKYGHIYYG